jgi:hypothetical protein
MKTVNLFALRNIKKFRFVGAVFFLIQIGLPSVRGATYDLAANYSTVSNPSGVWGYGAMTTLGGSFTLFTSEVPSASQNGVTVDNWEFGPYDPAIWHNGTTNTATSDGFQGVYPPGTVCLFAGDSNLPYFYGVARFTAPQTGLYQIQTAVQSYLNGPSAGDYDFHVLDNGVEIFGRFLAGNTGTAYTNLISLSSGDTIDFVVGPGQDGSANGSGVKINATVSDHFCPYPATATAIVYNNFVVGATITDPGCGYTNAPTVTIQGGGGSGATATATIANGAVTAINIISTGSSYTNAPQIIIASPPPPFAPTLSIGFSAVKVTQHVVPGYDYQLQSSSDLVNWTNVGSIFTATNENMVSEFEINVTGQFFRILQEP